MDDVPLGILTIAIAYFTGSVPTTWLIFYARTRRDLRSAGDGNVGSANAIRAGAGWLWGHIALLADVGKGLLSVSIARWLELPVGWWLAAGYVVMLGHMFPVWLRFQGGARQLRAWVRWAPFCPGSLGSHSR